MVVIIAFIAVIISPACIADENVIDLELTLAEKSWLDSRPEIVLAPATDFYPFEFFDENGNYRGVAADYIFLIEKRTGIKFRIVKIVSPEERKAKIASGEIDIVAAADNSPEITDHMLLTQPHIIIPGVIVSSKKYANLEELGGKRVAVTSKEQWGIYIESNYPAVQTVYVPNIATGLELIPLEIVDALVSDMATTSYYIHREGMTEIQVVGKVDADYVLGIATRRAWPELNSIMEKALASISDSEKDKIYRQWIHQKKSSIVHSSTFWTIVLIIFSGVVFVLIAILVWNQTLKKLVLHRTESLEQELQRRHAAEIELKDTHENLVRSHLQLKETQLQLINAEKMEIIGRLAAGIAHEVKNPLAVIRLGLDYISNDLEKMGSNNEALRDMGKAVQRANRVVNSLLDFSRERKLQIRNSKLNDIIEESLHLVRHELEQRNIKLVKNYDKQLPEMAIDPNKMEQVFINLFLNAIQAIRRDGTLYVSTYSRRIGQIYNADKKLEPGVENRDQLVIAEVGDTGPGIEEKIMGKIFDPFFTTKANEEGTGLGLSVTRNIVDLHHGVIEIKNRESGGVSVKIVLKIQD